MEKAKRIIITFMVAVMLILAVLTYFYIQKQNNALDIDKNSNILYYGDTCPHCKIVEEFMINNSIDEKISIIQKEVYNNITNGNELLKVGKTCEIAKEYIGAVPLLYSEGKCYLGDKDIIEYFKIKLGIIN